METCASAEKSPIFSMLPFVGSPAWGGSSFFPGFQKEKRDELYSRPTGVITLQMALTPPLLTAGFGAADERSYVVVQLRQRFIAHIDHVSRLIPVELNVRSQVLGDGQVFVLVVRGVEGRGQIIVSAVDHYLQARIERGA